MRIRLDDQAERLPCRSNRNSHGSSGKSLYTRRPVIGFAFAQFNFGQTLQLLYS